MKKILISLILLVFFLPAIVSAATYYVSTSGSDTNSGTQAQPWLTIQKAVKTVVAGDTIYVRGGQYNGIKNGWVFNNSGTQAKPITFANYPGEQVVLRITNATRNDYNLFGCRAYVKDHPDWQTPKADYIHIIGTDVTPAILSNGVESKKGIVMQGLEGEQSAGITASDCDYWEVAGVDFVETSDGIFTFKNNWGTMEEHSTDNWHVHDNRVYTFYRESGMQFNGDYNRIENNEIYKVTNRVDTPFGCQHFNFLGDHNIIRGNVISRLGSTASCTGILFEWDLSDMNTVEQNRIFDVSRGIDIEGGDNNIVRNNVIYATGTPDPYAGGIEIKSYDNSIYTGWPCGELTPLASSLSILPANDTAHPDYQYFYNPRNCYSYGNQIYNNVVHGFVEGIRIYLLAGENTIIRNNVFSGWTRGSVCYYKASDGTCKPLPSEVNVSNNAVNGNFGFVNLGSYDFRLTNNSPLINQGYDLGSLVPDDFNGVIRPQGAGYDIGAFEYIGSTPPPPSTPGDLNNDSKVDVQDLIIVANDFGKTSGFNNPKSDTNNDNIVDIYDVVFIASRFT
jgi:parallel beta-helix repeat protein